jgi:hypothetical protein
VEQCHQLSLGDAVIGVGSFSHGRAHLEVFCVGALIRLSLGDHFAILPEGK